jgi:NADH dehydrogenase FAD-containing subunit
VTTVILVGAGHVHLHIAAHSKALIERGARVLWIDPGEFWYSGMATGMLGGMYEPAEDQVNPRALIEAHGGKFLQDRVESVDTATRRLRLASESDIAYDYLSLNVGSRVNVDLLPGAANDATVWPVKPISNLWELRQHLEARSGESLRVAVIGGGPTGSEVAANLIALATRRHLDLRVTLVTRGERLIAQSPAGAARTLDRKLSARGLVIRTRTRIVRREGKQLIAEDGSRIAADLVVLATGLETNPLVHSTGLPTHPQLGLRINARLHSIADERVFAGGDCAAMEGFELPRLGVLGVRQAVTTHANLLASLEGKPLIEYRPQKRYLAILTLGDGTALSTWGPLWWNGRSSMRLKEFIDRRFLDRYRQHSEQPKAKTDQTQ